MSCLRNPLLAAAIAVLPALGAKALCAQTPVAVKAVPVNENLDAAPAKKELTAGWKTEKEARALTLHVPAPRGQIVDRNGIPLAQTRVVMYLALNFPFLGKDVTDAEIVGYGRSRIMQANSLLAKRWDMSPDKLIAHYKNRRWLPLVFSIYDNLNEEITADQQTRLLPLMKPGSGLLLQPAYLRVYPKGASAPHLIGYVGRKRALPVTPAQDGDPIFEETEGRDGLEKSFDKDLEGKPGVINVLFNPDGSKATEEMMKRPVPGNNVVTTIDYNFQKYAEDALAANTKSSAMVIMDVKTGDVMAMASYPLFDPNIFIPGITNENFQRLNDDKRLPMMARAFRGEYPPASTFKVVVSIAALESGVVSAKTGFDCSSSYWIGDRYFKNWNRDGEGYMNVVSAIKRSCNTWFYQAGIAIGSPAITDTAMRFGFGERTGIPLAAESAGFVPTDSWWMGRYGSKMSPGDIANLSIGQGATVVTPLQTAQAMAALADGQNMPQARLVKQIQDPNDRVVQAFAPQVRRRVDIRPDVRESVVKGMIAVVNGSGGTGRAAALEECQVAGKTGTAQWKSSEDRNLAWFTGFLPTHDPVYAYALVYEGQPGEDVSGGKKAAPIVHEVFEKVLKNAAPDEPLLIASQAEGAPKGLPISGDDEAIEGGRRSSDDMGPGSGSGAPPPPPPPPQEERRGFGGFLKKLFGGR
ncbi:MAG: penicillin-binding protein 2 [Verrucomicrobium sp.]|nr:penicillin-binding protein 2 [Verrucomicrobium sp.]